MKKTIILFSVLLSIGCITEITAQLSKGGQPLSFTQASQLKFNEVSFQTMPGVDVEALKAEDIYNDKIKDQPWRFGQDLFVAFNLKNSGQWETLPDGGRIWRLGINSPGALSINLTFDQYKLPEGAELFIYSADRKEILGAFTALNNQKDGYFATGLIHSESVIMEYYEPADVKFQGELNLWRVTHGYRSLDTFEKAFGSSGACNVNAICTEGDPIREQIRSVALIIMGGATCSGTLINNTNNDGVPYFLSANHCYSNPGAVVFRFNWESPTCENPVSSPAYIELSGAVDKARYASSDFWLMQMNTTPIEAHGLYYSGWNRTDVASINNKVWCIHHPRSDIKKISWADAGVDKTAYFGVPGSGNTHWRVSSWSDNTTTEPGSSGSALFDSEFRIIGQLQGGEAACDNTKSDWFGRIASSWTGGGTNTTGLSHWLDPLGSGVLTLDGYDPYALKYGMDAKLNAILNPTTLYHSLDLEPAFIIKNEGTDPITEAVVYYTLDGGDSTGISWSGNLLERETDTVYFPLISMIPGMHHIDVRVVLTDDENPGNDSLFMDFEAADCQNFSLPFFEGFDSAQLSLCWGKTTVSGTTPALSLVDTGVYPDCLPAQGPRMLKFNSYNAASGNSIRLESPSIEMTGLDSILMSFDWYQDDSYASNEDRLIVQYSLNGTDWNDVEEVVRYNDTLIGWDRKTIVLPDTINHQPSVYMGLLFISDWGANCYLDSLVITGTSIVEPYPDFYASTLSVEPLDTVIFYDHSINGPFTTYEWDFGEGAIPATATGVGPHKVIYETSGNKTVYLLLDNTYLKIKGDYISVASLIPPSPENLMANVDQNDVYLAWDVLSTFSDGFESNDFSKWNEVIEGDGTVGDTGYPFWHVLKSESLSYEGDHLAFVDWGFNLDTWLITPTFEITENSQLVFVWNSSYYWHVDPNDNGDLFVKMSLDNGNTWEELWTFGDIGVWETWAWYETTIFLSEFKGMHAALAFNLVANNNAEVSLDSVIFENTTGKTQAGTRMLYRTFPEKKTLKATGITGRRNPFVPEKLASIQDYTVYRDGTEIGKAIHSSYTDSNLEEGTYHYVVTANYTNPEGETGPSNEVTVNIGPEAIPGVEEEMVLFYPNPSEGLFTVKVTRPYTVTVCSINGMLVKEISVDGSESRLDLSDQQNGIYLLHFRSDDRSFVLKAMVQK